MLYVAAVQSRDREDEKSRELAAWEPSNSTEVRCYASTELNTNYVY